MPDRAWIAREYGVEAMRASALLNFGFAGALPFLLGESQSSWRDYPTLPLDFVSPPQAGFYCFAGFVGRRRRKY